MTRGIAHAPEPSLQLTAYLLHRQIVCMHVSLQRTAQFQASTAGAQARGFGWGSGRYGTIACAEAGTQTAEGLDEPPAADEGGPAAQPAPAQPRQPLARQQQQTSHTSVVQPGDLDGGSGVISGLSSQLSNNNQAWQQRSELHQALDSTSDADDLAQHLEGSATGLSAPNASAVLANADFGGVQLVQQHMVGSPIVEAMLEGSAPAALSVPASDRGAGSREMRSKGDTDRPARSGDDSVAREELANNTVG